MKNIHKLILIFSSILILIACKEDEYGKHSDVVYPVPTISTVTPNPKIGDVITINGQNFSEPNVVMINGTQMKIVSQTETEIKATLPRIFEQSTIKVINAFGRDAESSTEIKPEYPLTEVESWPEKIVRGRKIAIRGKNADLITDVKINNIDLKVNGLTQAHNLVSLLIPTTLEGSTAKIELKTILGTTIISSDINIENPPPPPTVPSAPLMLLDFEDGATHFLAGDLPGSKFTAQINRAGIAAPQGTNFFSLYAADIPSEWDYLGSIKVQFAAANSVDLSQFMNPHLTFRYNSADNVGNFQFKTVQGAWVIGSVFAPGTTNYPEDDLWSLHGTKGNWKWVTASLKTLMTSVWGSGQGVFEGFDTNLEIGEIELIFKQINGVYWNGTDVNSKNPKTNKQFKLNIDQIMITDGPYEGL